MKQFFFLVNDIGKQLDKYLNALPLDEKKKAVNYEIKELCALFTTDVIASTAYGIEANSMNNPDSEFRQKGRIIFQFTPWRAFEFITFFFIPQLVSICKCKVFSNGATDFLRSTFNYILSEREKSKNTRNDLVDLLISVKKSAKLRINDVDVKMEGDILVAQAAIFFTAGYETTSSTMSFALYELANAPEAQECLRQEIRDVLIKNNGEVTYDIILNMRYMHMVVQEVLRLYPPLPFFDRQCDVPSSDSKGYSLSPFSDFVVPDKMPVYIPIYAIQRDEKYYPNPNKFDPERFSPENKHNIVPYTYMPFGTGGRACIGERFGFMQAKIGLFYFLKNHYVKTSPKTLKPMRLEKRAMILQAEGGIYCDIVRDPLVA
ncbi:unnamed protein product [Hermetia illucens]|uniref:Cytochrome P450 n=2 Tax=Hermetia illucens TaxID=343691 RepID=A0A7R8UU50_HERIL|nr:unnamed protein product [Hermetia illucens]